jgi:DNA-binding NarL/FixJ family response regulator
MTEVDKTKIRYLMVDDHPAFRLGIISALADQKGFQCVAEAGTCADALHAFAQHKPELVLLDLRLPDSGGVECALAMLKSDPNAKIIVLTTFDSDEDVFRAIQAGVQGYLLKDASIKELVLAMRRVAAGKSAISSELLTKAERRSKLPTLTTREMQVLRCLAKGMSNKQAADALHVSDDTVKAHLKTLFAKLKVLDRTQAVLQAMKIGLLQG